MELIGIPIRVTVGKKVTEGKVELKLRTAQESEVYNISEIENVIKQIIEKEVK